VKKAIAEVRGKVIDPKRGDQEKEKEATSSFLVVGTCPERVIG